MSIVIHASVTIGYTMVYDDPACIDLRQQNDLDHGFSPTVC